MLVSAKHHVNIGEIQSTLEVPPQLEPVFRANPDLLPVAARAICKAVQDSFAYSETAPNNVTTSEIKLRASMCIDLITEAYFDMNLSMNLTLDLLPEAFMRSLLYAKSDREKQESAIGRTMWTADDPDPVDAVPLSETTSAKEEFGETDDPTEACKSP